MIFDELFDETYEFYDEGQSENRMTLPSAEDVFVSFMRHPNFQVYTGTEGMQSDQLRAIFGVAELARKEAARQKMQRDGRTESESFETSERVQRLCQALRSARRRVQSLTKTLREEEDRFVASEGLGNEALFARDSVKSGSTRTGRPAPSSTPLPGKPSGVDRG